MSAANVDCAFCLLGGAVGASDLEEILRTDPNSPAQSIKHQWSIIDGVEAVTGRPIRLISSLLLSDFPYNRRIFVRGEMWNHIAGSVDAKLGFINVLGLKHATRYVSCLRALQRWRHELPRGTIGILLIHGLVAPHVYAALAARRCWGGIVLVNIVTDPPSPVLRHDGWVRRLLRVANRWMLRSAMRRMDGLVVLTEQIARDFAPEVPAIVMEGIVSARDIALMTDDPPDCGTADGGCRPAAGAALVVMYCGALSEKKGLGLLLEAFRLLPSRSYRLWLFGKGDMEDEIRTAVRSDARITLHGFVSNKELAARLTHADILINVRPSDAAESRYSFPSKLMEYLLAGKVVISTSAAIPVEYHSHLCFLELETPAALAEKIGEVGQMAQSERWRRGRAARDFIRREKNVRVQAERMVQFAEGLARQRANDR